MLSAALSAAAAELGRFDQRMQPAMRAAVFRWIPIVTSLMHDPIALGSTRQPVICADTSRFWMVAGQLCASMLAGTYRPSVCDALKSLAINWMQAYAQ